MKFSSILSVFVAVSVLMVHSAQAEPISFDFANLTGATIQFTGTGDKIEFPATGYDFLITDSSSPLLTNLNGSISGTFNITGYSTPMTGVEQATVSTTNGMFYVDDGAAVLSANVDWQDITVYSGLSGVLNGMGLVNLTSVAYTGSNTALEALRDGINQTVVLSFQFSPLKKKTLAQLMTDGQVNSTSFSGSVSAVPEPSMCLMLGAASIVLVFFSRLRRKGVSAS